MRLIRRRGLLAAPALGMGLLLLTGCPPPPPDPGPGTTTTTTSTTTTTTVPADTTIDPTSGPAGTTISVMIPCETENNGIPVATAFAALLDDQSGLVVQDSVDNSAGPNAIAVVTLEVPLGAASGDYTVTSSCDTYTGTVEYTAVPFTVV